MIGKLPRSFYARPTEEVTQDLLGKVLVRRLDAGIVRGRIVEVEAYHGENDPGSHAFRGRTERTEVMFGPPGHVYVYFTYGKHFCMNVVAEEQGKAGAALLRALEPLAGIALMEANRGARSVVNLCNGPAKLCEALAITNRQNGADLEGSEIWIEDDGYAPGEVAVTSRVGLTRGVEFPLRYFLSGNPYVSPGKPSASVPRVQ